jgi:tetratricopeptide (TPR) repeat protein
LKKSVFLSYRRGVSADLARWLRDNLHQLGVDVFFDVESINAGRFANIIEREIQSRDYFVVLLTPETLESEWVRKEIQIALAARKNIVPITIHGFTFSNLPPEIGELAQYSGIPHQYEYADYTIERIKKALRIKPRRSNNLLLIGGIATVLIVLGVGAVIFLAVLVPSLKNFQATQTAKVALLASPTKNVQYATMQPSNTPQSATVPTQQLPPTDKPIPTDRPVIPTDKPVPSDIPPRPTIVPTDAYQAYIDLGDSVIHDKNRDPAISYYTNAIDFRPNQPDAYAKRAFAYKLKQDYASALNDFSAADARGMRTAQFYFDWGDTYIKPQIQQWDLAIATLNKVLTNNPTDYLIAVAYTDLGQAYAGKKSLSDAIKYYSTVLNTYSNVLSNDQFTYVRFLRGGAYVQVPNAPFNCKAAYDDFRANGSDKSSQDAIKGLAQGMFPCGTYP